MKFVAKGLLGSLQQRVAAATGIFGKDGRTSESEQMVILKVFDDGGMKFAELLTVAFVKDKDKSLLEDRMLRVLSNEDTEFLNGGNDDPAVWVF